MVLVGAACALALAILVGVRAESARAGERTTSLWAPAPSTSPDRLEQLVGLHAPPLHGRLEGTRPTGKSPVHSKRLDPRDDSAERLDGRNVALTRTLLSCALPTCVGRGAARPLIVNCPSQGPPRTA
jgi:hypothetical protein